MRLMSIVPEHTGYCRTTWINTNQVTLRFDDGVTVFCRHEIRPWWALFLPIRVGAEFHGIVRDRNPGVVEPVRWS